VLDIYLALVELSHLVRRKDPTYETDNSFVTTGSLFTIGQDLPLEIKATRVGGPVEQVGHLGLKGLDDRCRNQGIIRAREHSVVAHRPDDSVCHGHVVVKPHESTDSRDFRHRVNVFLMLDQELGGQSNPTSRFATQATGFIRVDLLVGETTNRDISVHV